MDLMHSNLGSASEKLFHHGEIVYTMGLKISHFIDRKSWTFTLLKSFRLLCPVIHFAFFALACPTPPSAATATAPSVGSFFSSSSTETPVSALSSPNI